MSLSLSHFVTLRPALYHLTSTQNLGRIAQTLVLDPASTLFRAAGRKELCRLRRRGTTDININGETIRIRDQDPLHRGNIALLNGWTFEDLVSHLNDHVFLWPGKESGPNSYGQRHFERYVSEKPVVLRFRTLELFSANREAEPLFCRYNSGAPRWSRGEASPRGPAIFQNATAVNYSVTAVVELTFKSRIVLPGTTEVGCSTKGPWRPLVDN